MYLRYWFDIILVKLLNFYYTWHLKKSHVALSINRNIIQQSIETFFFSRIIKYNAIIFLNIDKKHC